MVFPVTFPPGWARLCTSPRVELAALSALAALGCGLAAAQGDFLFVVVFAATSIVTIIAAIRRLR
jgi:hypothetical protein